MMKANRTSEDQEDVENVEAWAEVIEDMLRLVPMDRRAAVLELASKKRREADSLGDGLHFIDITKTDTPGLRHWNAIMRLQSLVVQVFVRHITNNHSPEDAAQILLAQHPYGHGSGQLGDYLEGIGMHEAYE
jgi:hypothetical protein